MLEILDVNSKSLQKEFVDFQYKLYEDCPQFVPPFRSDIFLMMNKKKHPFYDHSDSDFFIAKRDSKVVGKIAALENKPFNEYHQCKDSEFYLLIVSMTRKLPMLFLIRWAIGLAQEG